MWIFAYMWTMWKCDYNYYYNTFIMWRLWDLIRICDYVNIGICEYVNKGIWEYEILWIWEEYVKMGI